jgi:hypothetical protein
MREKGGQRRRGLGRSRTTRMAKSSPSFYASHRYHSESAWLVGGVSALQQLGNAFHSGRANPTAAPHNMCPLRQPMLSMPFIHCRLYAPMIIEVLICTWAQTHLAIAALVASAPASLWSTVHHTLPARSRGAPGAPAGRAAAPSSHSVVETLKPFAYAPHWAPIPAAQP